MSDDKKNIFSLVGLVPKQDRELIAQRKQVLSEMFKEFERGESSYVVVAVDKDGFTSFITDMDLYAANFQLDKVKLNLLVNPDDVPD